MPARKGKAARTVTPGTASKTLKLQAHFNASYRVKQAIETVAFALVLNVPLLTLLFTGCAMAEQLSFLPPPPFAPQWPTRGTLADRALKMFFDGKMIDHPDFENSTQSWRLGAVVFTLRTLGWPVETIEIPSPTEHSPDRVIALYHLPSKYIAEAMALNGGATW